MRRKMNEERFRSFISDSRENHGAGRLGHAIYCTNVPARLGLMNFYTYEIS